jgi:hypothetical protein
MRGALLTAAMNILADPNMTDSEAALAAPAPFVELRRGFYGAIAVDPASHFSSYTAIQSTNPSSRRDNHVLRRARRTAGEGARGAHRLPPIFVDQWTVSAASAQTD